MWFIILFWRAETIILLSHVKVEAILLLLLKNCLNCCVGPSVHSGMFTLPQVFSQLCQVELARTMFFEWTEFRQFWAKKQTFDMRLWWSHLTHSAHEQMNNTDVGHSQHPQWIFFHPHQRWHWHFYVDIPATKAMYMLLYRWLSLAPFIMVHQQGHHTIVTWISRDWLHMLHTCQRFSESEEFWRYLNINLLKMSEGIQRYSNDIQMLPKMSKAIWISCS